MNGFSKELEFEQNRINGIGNGITYSDKKFYEQFVIDYNTSEKLPKSLSADVCFILNQQRKKLKSMGIEMYESITDIPFSEIIGNSFSDRKYILKHLSKSLYRTVDFKHTSGKKYRLKQNIYANAGILYVQPNKIADNEKLNCPYCKKISSLKQLEQGCENCNKNSFITGIFPKIKSWTYKKNNSLSVKDIIKTLLIFCILGMIIGIPFGIKEFINDVSGIFTSNTIYKAISDVFTAPLKGAMIGIIISMIYLLLKVIHDSIRISDTISRTNEMKKKIALSFTEHENKFCFENFESKIIYLIKLVIFCDDRSKLVSCELENHVRKFCIIDSTYLGFMELKNLHIEYGVCNVTLDVHMSDVYFDGKKFLKKNDIFTIKLSKRLTKRTNIGFELSNVTCPICFEHYNTFENNECHFCASKYRPDAKDWVITDIKIK